MKYIGRSLLLGAALQQSLTPTARADDEGSASHSVDESKAEGQSPLGQDAAMKSDEAKAGATADSRTAYADHLFQEGLRLMKSHDCPQAILKFQNSDQLEPSSAARINLADCYAVVGRSASAWRTFRQAATLAGQEGRSDVKEKAFKAMSKLSPSLTKLIVIPPRGATTMALTLNGEPLGDDDGLPIALDPGENIVEAKVAGQPPWRRTVSATEVGATIVIEVPAATAATESPGQPWTTWKTAAVVTGGIGVVGIVVGLALVVSAKATHDEARQHCSNGLCTVTGHDLWEEANHKADAATVSMVAGAILAAGGLTLWLTAPSATKTAIGVRSSASGQQVVLRVALDRMP